MTDQALTNLVIAAREAFDTGCLPGDEERALDRALEPYSATVPYADEPTPPVVEEGRREAMARIIEEARAKYREPTDWDYGALDACTRIERALVALTSVEGVGDEVREALNVIIKLLDMEGDTLSEAQQRANVIQAWTVAVGLRATLGAPHEG